MARKVQRRLVVTGHDYKGRSRIASDTLVEGKELPGRGGRELTMIWGSDEVMLYPDGGHKPAFEAVFPPIGGFRMIEIFLPAKTNEDGDWMAQRGAVEHDQGRPGMHRSASIDLGYVIEGRIMLQLDNEETTLCAGDLFVQSGSLHAWLNPFDEPARLIVVVVGAHVKEGA